MNEWREGGREGRRERERKKERKKERKEERERISTINPLRAGRKLYYFSKEAMQTA